MKTGDSPDPTQRGSAIREEDQAIDLKNLVNDDEEEEEKIVGPFDENKPLLNFEDQAEKNEEEDFMNKSIESEKIDPIS